MLTILGALISRNSLAIAACAIEHDAVLWTANTKDFDDIPGLRLL